MHLSRHLLRVALLAAAFVLTACGGGDTAPPLKGDGSEMLSAPRGPVQAGSPLAVLEQSGSGSTSQAAALSVEPTAFFDWAERQFATLFPGPQTDRAAPGFVYRYYPATDLYLAVLSDRVYALGPVLTGGQLLDLGPLENFASAVYSSLGVASVRIAAGGDGYSLALRADGKVLAWGDMYGGPGVSIPGTVATVVSGPSRIKAVYASSFMTAAIDADGAVWAWGYERTGLLSGRQASGFLVPTPAIVASLGKVVDLTICEERLYTLRADGKVFLAPGITTSNSFQTKEVPGLEGVVRFADWSGFKSGSDCTGIAIKADGTVWRLNDDGSQFIAGATHYNVSLRQITGLPAIKQVACHDNQLHCVALAKDGSVWTWGDNSQGQLGVGDTIGRIIPVKVAGLPAIAKVAATIYSSYAITSGGGLYAWGIAILGHVPSGDERRPARVFGDASNIIDMSSSFDHSMLLLRDGTVWSWGSNGDGQLGDGTLAPRDFISNAGLAQALGIQLN